MIQRNEQDWNQILEPKCKLHIFKNVYSFIRIWLPLLSPARVTHHGTCSTFFHHQQLYKKIIFFPSISHSSAYFANDSSTHRQSPFVEDILPTIFRFYLDFIQICGSAAVACTRHCWMVRIYRCRRVALPPASVAWALNMLLPFPSPIESIFRLLFRKRAITASNYIKSSRCHTIATFRSNKIETFRWHIGSNGSLRPYDTNCL